MDNCLHKKISFVIGSSIESAVNELQRYKESGVLACGEFNGVTLYSDTVTLDDAYLKITGKTKAEIDAFERNWKEEYDRKEREFKERIPTLDEEWKAKGKEVLSKDYWEYWDRVVPIRLNDLYHGMELGCCLDIVKILNGDGTLEKAKQEIESQDHSGMSFGLVCAMVREFCDRGEEFYKFVNKRD